MKKNSVLIIIAFVSLIVLLIIELATHYDTYSRQVALSITNLVGGGVYLTIFLLLKKRGIELSWIAAWLVALAIWADAMGNFLHLFHDILWWDKLAHFISSIAPTVVFWLILYEYSKRRIIVMPRWLINLTALAMTAMLASLYEVSEYIGDSFFPTRRITDLFDTADDLMWNILGAIIGVVLCNIFKTKKQEGILTKSHKIAIIVKN